MPPFPRESACSNVPSATYVMPSMSRCGCIGHAAPGTRRSSLNTRRSPRPIFASSQYWSKLKCQFAENHPPSAWKSDARGRRTTVTATRRVLAGARRCWRRGRARRGRRARRCGRRWSRGLLRRRGGAGARLGCRSGSEVRLDLLQQLVLRDVADDTLRFAPVLEQDHGGDGPDAEAPGGDRVGVDVELRDLDLIALLARDLLQYRSDHAAR